MNLDNDVTSLGASVPFSRRPNGMAPLLLALVLASSAFGQSTTWTGTTSSAWGTAANWSAGLPNAGVDAVIPAGTPNSPTTSGSASPACKTLSVSAGATLTVVPASSLSVNQDMILTGTVTGNGTLRAVGSTLDGVISGVAAQSINLEVAKTAPRFFSLSSALTINGNLTVTSGTFRVAFGFVTLTVNGNAQMNGGSLTPFNQGTLDVNGNVTFAGTVVAGACPNINCAGNFVADANVQATTGVLTMDGGGARTVTAPGAIIPGLAPAAGTTVTTTTSPLAMAGFTCNGGFSTAGTMTVNGSFTVPSGGNVVTTGGGVHQVTGDVTSAGTLAMTGTLRMTGSATAIVHGSTFPTLEVAKTAGTSVTLDGPAASAGLIVSSGTFVVASGFVTLSVNGTATFSGGVLTVFNQGTIAVTGDVTFSGTSVAGPCPNLTCGGNFTANAAMQATSGTLTMNGSGTHTISAPGAAIPGLSIASGSTTTSTTPSITMAGFQANGTFSTSGTIDVNGPFGVGASGSVTTTGGGTHTVSGDLTCDGTLAMAGTVRMDGSTSANLHGTSSFPVIEIAKTGGALVDINGAGTATGLVVTSGTVRASVGFFTLTINGNATFAGGTLTVFNIGTIAVSGNVTFSGTTVSGACPNLTCGGNFTANAAMQATSGTLTMNGAGSHSIAAPGAAMPAVVVASGSTTTSTTAILTMAGLQANGAFTTSGTIDVNGPFGVGASGSVTTTGGGTHTVSGDVSCSGTLAMTGTLRLDGTSSANLSGASPFPTIEVAKTGAVNVDLNGNCTATGLLVTSGNLRVSVGFFTLTVNGNATFAGGSLTIFNVGTIDVNGNVTFSGTSVAGPCPNLFCAGNLVANAAMQATSGTLTMDGPGAHTISATGAGLPALVIAAGANVSTATSPLTSLGLTTNGSFTTSGVLDVNGSFGVGAAGVVTTTGGGVHTISGDATCSGTLAMTGTVRLDGTNAANLSCTSSFPIVEIAKTPPANVDLNGNCTSTGLILTSGTFRVSVGFFSMSVNGNSTLAGGVLTIFNVGTLHMNGNVTFSGTTLAGTSPTLSCGGNLVMNSAVQVTSGTLTMDGPGAHTISAPGAGMPVIVIAAGTSITTTTSPFVAIGLTANGSFSTPGTLDINGNVNVGAAGTLTTTGGGSHTVSGDFDCTGTLAMTGNVVFDGTTSGSFGSTSPFPPIVVAKTGGGMLDLHANATCSSLSVQSGLLRVSVGTFTLTVNGNATFTGGSLSAFNVGILDVNGNVTFSGTAVSAGMPTIRCAGNFVADAAFAPTGGTLELDGPTPTTFGPAIAGSTLVVPILTVKNNVRSPTSPVLLRTTAIDVQAGGTLTVSAGRLAVSHPTAPTTVTVSGLLTVLSGSDLGLSGQTLLTVNATGTLSLQGTPLAAATLSGENGGGYSATINGTISAKNFVVKEAGTGGLLVTAAATIAAPPNDLRAGTFDFRTGAPANSVLLDIRRTAPTNVRYSVFRNTPNVAGVFNVRTLANSAPISFTNFTGAWSGPGFENDPSNLISWTAPEHTTLANFRVQQGAELATISWNTTVEYDVSIFILERSTNAGGPFTTVFQHLPGSGGYGYADAPLVANTTYFYRLSERLTHDVINVLANGSVVPYSSGPPANVYKVGGGGPFATIQAAINAAASPDSVVWVTPGAYLPFTIGPAGPTNLRLVGGPGVTVNTATGPVVVTGIGAGRVIEIDGLAIGTTSTANDGVQVTNCAGTVILDAVTAQAGPTKAAMRVTNSQAVAIQSCLMTGSPGLQLASGSTVAASRGTLNSVVATTSSLQLCDLVPGSQTITPPSTVTTFPGPMPLITLPTLPHLGTNYTFACDAFPNGTVLIAASLNAAYVASLGVGFDMPFLLDPASIVLLPPVNADALGHVSLGFALEPTSILLGVNLRVQALCQNPLTSMFRFTNLATMTGMP